MDLVEVVKLSQVIILIIGGMLSSGVTAIVTFKIMQYKLDRNTRDQENHRLDMKEQFESHRREIKELIAAHKTEVSENSRALWNKMEKFEDKFDRLFAHIGKIEGILVGKANKE